MRPSSVFIAVATTTAWPVPAATLVPMNTMFSRSPSGMSSALQSRGLLRHRLRLAGQRGLDALERGRLQEPGIRRDQVAGFQREDVAGDDSRGGNRSDLPVAPHLGLGRGHLLERRDGFLRAELLVEADDGVEDDDGEDGDGSPPLRPAGRR